MATYIPLEASTVGVIGVQASEALYFSVMATVIFATLAFLSLYLTWRALIKNPGNLVVMRDMALEDGDFATADLLRLKLRKVRVPVCIGLVLVCVPGHAVHRVGRPDNRKMLEAHFLKKEELKGARAEVLARVLLFFGY